MRTKTYTADEMGTSGAAALGSAMRRAGTLRPKFLTTALHTSINSRHAFEETMCGSYQDNAKEMITLLSASIRGCR